MLPAMFYEIEDHRIDRTKKYPAGELVFSALTAVHAGALSWYDIEEISEILLDFLREFAPFENGIPSHDTYNRFFGKLKPEAFEKLLNTWIHHMFGSESLEGRHIAIDGKQIRGSSHAGGTNIHMVTAWVNECQISFGQLKAEDKSNEITAIPKLLNSLEIKGAEITMDAMGAQTEIVGLIDDAGAEYKISLKGNQGGTLKEAQEICANYNPRSHAYIFDEGKGAVVERECSVFTVTEKRMPSSKRWKGLKTVARIVTTTTNKKTKGVSEEIRFFICNRIRDAEDFINASKRHWTIERQCHWYLDVFFKEDNSRKCSGNAAENFSRLQRMAMSMVKRHKFDHHMSFKMKRKALFLNKDIFREVFRENFGEVKQD